MKLSDMEVEFIARVAYSAQRVADNGRPIKTWDELSPGAKEVYGETVEQIEADKLDELTATSAVFISVVVASLEGRKRFQKQLVREVAEELSLAQRLDALEQKLAQQGAA